MLSAQQLAARNRAHKKKCVERLTARLDHHVALAELHKPGSKSRALWMFKADTAREKLRKVDH